MVFITDKIYDTIFRHKIFACIGDSDECIKQLDKKYNVDISDVDFDDCYGMMIPITHDGSHGSVLWLEELVMNPGGLSVLVHECVHVAQNALQCIDVQQTRKSWEAFSCYTDSVFFQVLRSYKKYKQKCRKKKKQSTTFSTKATQSKESGTKKA